MPELTRRPRPEPPLTAPARRTAARTEPPLTAPRAAAPAGPVLRAPAAPPPVVVTAVAATVPPLAPPPRAELPEPPAPREALPAAPTAPRDTPVTTPIDAGASQAEVAPLWQEEAQRPIRRAFGFRLPGRRGVVEPVGPETAAGSLRRTPARPRDPAPSRLSYRLQRFWLTPVYRKLVRVGLPVLAVAFAAGAYLSDEGRRDALTGQATALVRQFQERPEFMVNLMAIEGASAGLADAIRVVLPVDFPVSSFDLDLEEMRGRVAELDAVAAADLRVRPGGILAVAVTERLPAVIWRDTAGLTLLDATGHRVAGLGSRLERPDLPVIAGEGADRAVPEALALIEAAAPVSARLRGLVRMGDRRWDVVLDNGQRILLPQVDPRIALERVMALADAEDMLDRDVSVIDMRYGARPTLRLTQRALDTLRGREIETGATNG